MHGPFLQKIDCTGKLGIQPLVRMVICFKMLSYGNAPDELDESYQISEMVANESLKCFCRLVVELFGDEYLRKNPSEDKKRDILELNSRRGFPGMFGSWDCKHFKWNSCPTRLAGQHLGKDGKTLVLEAVVDPYLFIWRLFFGEPGSLNDINILNRSTILRDILSQNFNTKVDPYTINKRNRDWMYFLVDGIYPKLAIFGSAINIPTNEKEEIYQKMSNAHLEYW